MSKDLDNNMIPAFWMDLYSLYKLKHFVHPTLCRRNIYNAKSCYKVFLLLMKSHLQSYPCPLHLNSFWNLGFLLGVSIIIQIITGIFLGLHYTSLHQPPISLLLFTP